MFQRWQIVYDLVNIFEVTALVVVLLVILLVVAIVMPFAIKWVVDAWRFNKRNPVPRIAAPRYDDSDEQG